MVYVKKHPSVTILEKLNGTGLTATNYTDKFLNALRKTRELHWMLKLKTLYRYGLNDKVGDEHKDNLADTDVGLKFSALERQYECINRGSKHKGTEKLFPNTFFQTFLSMFKIDKLSHLLNFIRTSLSSMKKSSLKIVFDQANTRYKNKTNRPFVQYQLVVLDVIESNYIKTLLKKKSTRKCLYHQFCQQRRRNFKCCQHYQ